MRKNKPAIKHFSILILFLITFPSFNIYSEDKNSNQNFAFNKETINNQINFKKIDKNADKIQFNYKEANEEKQMVLDKDGTTLKTLKNGDGKIKNIETVWIGWIDKIGTIDLDGDRNEEIFIDGGYGGSGATTYSLNILFPKSLEIITLTLEFNHQSTKPIPYVYTSDNFYKEEFLRGREFLNIIKYNYGYTDEEETSKDTENPNLAAYFWAKKNDEISAGKMFIKRYKGKYKYDSPLDTLQDGDIIYTANFKNAVVGYDTKLDEFFIVFHPHNNYSWPTLLKKSGHYLIIGTRGEGLAIVNVDNFYLIRYGINSKNGDVEKIEIKDSKIIVNDSDIIDMPTF